MPGLSDQAWAFAPAAQPRQLRVPGLAGSTPELDRSGLGQERVYSGPMFGAAKCWLGGWG